MSDFEQKFKRYSRLVTYSVLTVFAGAIGFLGFKDSGVTSEGGSLIQSAYADGPPETGDSDSDTTGDDGDDTGDGNGDEADDGSSGNGSEGAY